MKKKGKFVEGLSPAFWNSYKLFLKGEMSFSGLQNRFEKVEDVLFFKEEYGERCDVLEGLKKLELKRLNSLVAALLLAIKDVDDKTKKKIFRKILMVFLGNYSCFAKANAKEKIKDIMLYFIPSMVEVPTNEELNQSGLEMLHFFLSSRDFVKDKETFIQPVVFKLICLYIALAVSDKEGQIKCHNLGKQIDRKWSKSTPESVTLSYLKEKEKNSKLPISEFELLNEYSF